MDLLHSYKSIPTLIQIKWSCTICNQSLLDTKSSKHLFLQDKKDKHQHLAIIDYPGGEGGGGGICLVSREVNDTGKEPKTKKAIIKVGGHSLKYNFAFRVFLEFL